MCSECWELVPLELQREVYRTVVLRGTHCDATWAPWWRAQAKAIAHVAYLNDPNETKRDTYLDRAEEFAAKLESVEGARGGGEASARARAQARE
jgi:hypothetical protein